MKITRGHGAREDVGLQAAAKKRPRCDGVGVAVMGQLDVKARAQIFSRFSLHVSAAVKRRWAATGGGESGSGCGFAVGKGMKG